MKRAVALLIVGAALWPSRGAGQSRTVLVLPVAIGEELPSGLADDAAALGESLAALRGAVITPDEASARLRADGSEPPPAADADDVDRWLARARDAVRSIAAADYDAARVQLAEARASVAGRALALARDPARARQLLDVCLYDVRVRLETGDGTAARSARGCRHEVPRGEPSPYQHPPEVTELLARVDGELSSAPDGVLRVESEPAGCVVRVQGVELGRTPFVSVGLGPGEHAVQVECDGVSGRIHRVHAGDDGVVLRVDARRASVVRSVPALALVHPDEPSAEAWRFVDALEVAARAGAAEVWLVSRVGGAGLRVDRVVVADRTVAASALTMRASLAAATSDLLAGRSRDHTGPEPMRIARWDPEPSRAAVVEMPVDRTAEIAVGSVLGGLAIAGFVTAWALYGSRLDLGPELDASGPLDPDFIPLRDTWLNRRYAIWAFAGAGGALAISALPLLMHTEEGTPWWSWLVGAAGLAAAGVGVAEIVTAATCADDVDHDQRCVEHAAAVDRGAIVISMAAPLVAVPLVYLLRDALGGASVTVEASAERMVLHARGTF